NQLQSKVFRIDGVAVGVEENVSKTAAFRVYPNPASEKLFVNSIKSTNTDSPFTIFISNVLGEVQYSASFHGNDTSVDLNQFSEGVYFVTLTSDFTSETFPVIINRAVK
ncbi:MAG: T9SS type A sorting domain-containing protein, partial [Bacteroidota bacterium]